MGRACWVLLILLAGSYVCDAYRILVVFPLAGKSHGILGEGVVRHLLNAGHEVTYITPFPTKKPHSNLTQIDLSSTVDLFPDDSMNIKSIMDGKLDFNDYALFLILSNFISKSALEHENVQNLLADTTQHFDLVIAEWMFNELYASFSAVYEAPLIWFSTMEPHTMILYLVDDYLNPAYNGLKIREMAPFTFYQRAFELYSTIRIALVRDTVAAFLQYRYYNSLIVPHIEKRGRIAPSFSDVKFNASLVLGNSHVSMGQATRVPQNYKPVGGYHIEETAKPLPQDLQKLLDESKHGVIYFSMGSNLKSKDLPDEVKVDLLEMLGTLKQTVLWKFEETLPNLPKNVHILSWAPQQSILSHPNCVLFITHGGQLSTTEALHTGTPIIGVPVFGDQFNNIERAVSKGYAKRVPLSYTMASELKDALNDMIGNPKYSQKMKELNFIYHHRPMKPGPELVFWVEHIIKTGGAPHLRSVALQVPLYQKLYLDFAIVLLIVLYILVKAYRFIKPLVFSNKVKASKKKKN